MLHVDGIDVYYGEVQVLREVSFSIKPGDIVSLLGSNGAGKTTTAKAISGLLKTKRGSIRFMGQEISELPAHRRVEMGLVQVPEGRKLFPTLNVLENLELGSYLKGPKANRGASLEHVMAMFPILGRRSHQPAGTLSGGEQQMVAIARGLMSQPKLLILDEPSLGLAPLVVESIFEIIERIRSEGVTVLLVEQNVPQALGLSSRAFVLEEGRIALSGTGKELLDNEQIKKVYLGLGEEECLG